MCTHSRLRSPPPLPTHPIAVNAHPILAALDGTPHAWLRALLAAFQTGAIDAFNAVVAGHRAAFESQPALVAASAAIKEKVALLAVMELAGRKPPAERTLGFDEVAAETRLPGDQVEWVLMRAFSLGLLRGSIDQVDRVAHVSYVRPRVLDAGQVAGLKGRVDEWRSKAHGMLLYLEDNSRELMM
jgi:26S proteasome regulatory subunit N9